MTAPVTDWFREKCRINPDWWHTVSPEEVEATVRALEERALIAEGKARGAERALSDYREIHER